MNAVDPILQYVAWFIALIELIVGLYILALNVWHTANRHVSGLLLAIGGNTLALGMLAAAADVDQARSATIILSAIAPAVAPLLLIVAVALLRPQWMSGWRHWLWSPLYALAILPIFLTAIDATSGTTLLYTGLAEDYPGGVVAMFGPSGYVNGAFALLPRIATNLPIPILLIGLVWVLFSKQSSTLQRRLALVLLIVVLVGAVGQFVLLEPLGQGMTSLSTSTVFALAYGYVGFRQMVSERRLQRGSLRVRLVLLALAIALPVLLTVAFLGNKLASDALSGATDRQLGLINDGLKNSVQTWLTLNIQTVQELVTLPDIVSMDAARQKPVLQAVNAAHPQTYLVMTMDTSGMNVARNDDEALRDYSDRVYFTGAMAGRVTLQTLIARTTGNPALVIGAPILDSSGQIIGVGAIASELGDVSMQASVGKVGETGETYVVDEANQIVAHSNPAVVTQPKLVDAAGFSPVVYLRQKGTGYLTFADEQGIRWRAFVDRLENDWGIVVQQQETELQGALQTFANALITAIFLGALMMAVFLGFAMRQAFQPVSTLTSTATAIAAGDLTREAPVESQDELGTLARVFNSMTAQLRDLIGSLEDRVTTRTADLEQRTRYLQASAEVGRAAGSILEVDQLIRQVVEVIRERFDLYYVALFTVDQVGEQAVLRAGTGEAGRARLARGFQLPLDESSMIAWCINNRQPRIAQEAEKDEVRLVSPELPDTRSEVALPLRSRGQVIGALSLQSDRPNAFDEAALTVLQVMADQVAVALDNARLFAESEVALEQSRRAYGELSRRAWVEMLRAGQVAGYRYEKQTVVPARGEWRPEMRRAAQSGRSVVESGKEAGLAVPLKVRDQVIGVVNFRRTSPDRAWTEQENALAESLAEQLGVALESARLYQDTQRRAAREQVSSQITARMRESLDMDAVLQTAVREMRQALDLAEVEIQLQPDLAGDDAEA